MAEELGRIEKPSAEDFAGTRKLIIIPLVFSGKDAPEDFQEIYERCWEQIDQQVKNLELKLGEASRIYHEMIFNGGEEGMKIIEQLNPKSHQMVKARDETGAGLQPVEDPDLALEHMDWERCLMVAMGQNVRGKIAEFHRESSTKRYQHMARKIDETLGQNEVGLLFVREGHPIQFTSDMEVFNVYPPAMDELNRWMRDKAGSFMSESSES